MKSDLEYVIFVPADIQGINDPKGILKFPLILYLHGSKPEDFSGETHKDTSVLLKYAESMAAKKEEFPFFIVAPVMPKGRGRWLSHEKQIFEIIERIARHYPIDTDRFYLTGYSMGGSGSWSIAISNPDKFAALAPICGGGNPGDVWKIDHLPIWIFHGAKDTVVPLSRSREMVDALKLCGNDAELTVYPETGHDSWTETYNNPELYKWFLNSRRMEPRKENKAAQIACSLVKGIVLEPRVLFVQGDTNGKVNAQLCMKNLTLADGNFSLSITPNEAFSPSSDNFNVAIPANSEYPIDLELQLKKGYFADDLPPLDLAWTMICRVEEKEIKRDGRQEINFASYLDCPMAAKSPVVDGDLEDWGPLPFKVDKPAQILLDPATYSGAQDCRFEFGLAYDEQYIYIALKVFDDKSYLDPEKYPWQQDGVEIRLDARDEKKRITAGPGREFDEILLIALSPARSDTDQMVFFNRERMPDGVTASCVRTEYGHNTEIGIPVAYLDKMQGREWENFRLNIAVDDYDVEGKGAQLWWKKDWRSEKSITANGSFRRK